MRRTNEPNWPGRPVPRVLIDAGLGMESFKATADAYELGVRDARTAWLAANDDPSADLPGTVRISPDEMVYVRSDGVDDGSPWARVGSGPDNKRAGFWQQDSSVVGWRRGTPVEGTLAAKAVK